MPTFYTIQHYNKWLEFEATGQLIANESFIESEFLPAYKWIIKKMNELCKPYPALNINYPIWGWYKYSLKKMRPDLRCAGLEVRGERAVLIEFEETFENVLLTEFYEWHMILNTHSELEHKLETTIIDEHEKYAWADIIIDPANKERVADAIIQATMWKVDMEQVKSVRHFIAR